MTPEARAEIKAQEEIEATLGRLTSGVMQHGHRMTISEALAVILYDDRERSPEISTQYASGSNKVIVDNIARRLRQAGWYKRKVQRWGSRRIRWVNPTIEPYGGSTTN